MLSSGPDGLPFDARFGDSTPIGEQVVHQIDEAHLNASVRVPWLVIRWS